MKGYLVFVLALMLAVCLVSAAENPITISTFEPSESPISEGETTTLSVTVQNTDENTSLTSSTAKVCLPSGLSFTTTNETCVTKALTQDGQSEGTIAASGQTSETWQISGDVADSYEITVNVEGYLGSEKYTKDKDTSLTVTSSTPLTLSLIDDITGTIYAGSTFTLSAQISNTGGSDATGVKIRLTSSCVTSSPASGIWRNVTSTGQSAGTVASGKSVSISWSATAGSATGSCSMDIDVVSDESGNPSDTHTITISSTGDGNGDGTTGGGISGGAPPAQSATRRPTLVPGVGLRNNTKLQAAIEKVLAKGKMSEQARENMLRLSASITSNISTTRMFNASGTKSRITTMMRYSGQKKAKNFILFESLPKAFANNASLVVVTAPAGTTTEITEEDPSWIIYFPTLNPNQEFTVTYEVSGIKSSSVIDGMTTEVYAESLEEAEAAPEGEEEEAEEAEAGEKETLPTEKPFVLDANTLLMAGIGVVSVIIVVLLVLFVKSKKGSGAKPSALQKVKQDLGQ
jgi:hypothetical protein